ncbi:MAG: hypothetical protein GY835_27210 [bacterium]|nr:hypothetical protein [bacterium]
MGFSRFYLKELDFILTRHPRELDDESLIRYTIDFNKEFEGSVRFREISDCRGLQGIDNLTVEGTTRAAELEIDRPNCRLAILVKDTKEHYGMARAYQMFASDKRGAVEVFTDLTKALIWLNYSDAEIEIIEDFMENPVNPAKPAQ